MELRALVFAMPIATAFKSGALAIKVLPAFDKPVGAQLGIVTKLGFGLHRTDYAWRVPRSPLRAKAWHRGRMRCPGRAPHGAE